MWSGRPNDLPAEIRAALGPRPLAGDARDGEAVGRLRRDWWEVVQVDRPAS